MGLIDSILGKASEVDGKKIRSDFENVLLEGETVETAFAVSRQCLLFTDKRMIFMEVQGLIKSENAFTSVPYRSVVTFSANFAKPCTLTIYLVGREKPFVFEFGRESGLETAQMLLAAHVGQL